MTESAVEVRASRHPDVPANPGIRVKALKGCTNIQWQGQTTDVWVDVESPSPEQVRQLDQFFELNRLALEDALQIGHWARFEVYPEHVFLIFRTLAEPEDVTDRTERVSVFWYPDLHTLITIRNEPVTYVESVWHELDRFHERGPLDVLHTLLQRGTETYFTFLDALEEATDNLEHRVFADPRTAAGRRAKTRLEEFASEVFALRSTMIASRKLTSSSRETVAQFSRHATQVSVEGAILLRDVSDQLARVYDGLDSARDVVTGLLDVHLNVQNNRMNEVMKTLTTVSAVFLPLTFLAGVWGMNFHFMPELAWPLGYAFAWATFIAVAVLLAVYFKRRGWW